MNEYKDGYDLVMKTAGFRTVSIYGPLGALHRKVDDTMGTLGVKENSKVRDVWRKLRHQDGVKEPDIDRWKQVPKKPVPPMKGVENRQQIAAKKTWNDWNDWGERANRGSLTDRAKSIVETLRGAD